DQRGHEPESTPGQSPALVGTMFANSAFLVQHINDMKVLGRSDREPADGDLEQVKRAMLAGHGSVRLGDWAVMVGSVGTMSINTTVYQSPSYEDVVAATREIQENIEKEEVLRTLRDYMAAIRRMCAEASYLSIRGDVRPLDAYVPLSAKLPGRPDETIGDAVS